MQGYHVPNKLLLCRRACARAAPRGRILVLLVGALVDAASLVGRGGLVDTHPLAAGGGGLVRSPHQGPALALDMRTERVGHRLQAVGHAGEQAIHAGQVVTLRICGMCGQ